MAYYLLMDGVDDRLTINGSPLNNLTAFEFDLLISQREDWHQIVNFGGNLINFSSNTLNIVYGTNYDYVSVNGINVTSGTPFIPIGERVVLKGVLKSGMTNNGTGSTFFTNAVSQYLSGKLYSIKLYRGTGGSEIVSHFDFTTGSLSDTLGGGGSLIATGATFVEETPSGQVFTVSLSESVSLNDFSSKAIFKRIVESASVIDSSFKRLSKTIVDSISSTDGATKKIGKNVKDNVMLSESISKRFSIMIVDSIATSESLDNSNSKEATLSDTLLIADTISKKVSIAKSESIGLQDFEKESSIKNLFDTISQSDSIQLSSSRKLIISDSINIQESLHKSVSINIGSIIDIQDSTTTGSSYSVILYDVIISSDNLSSTLPNAPKIIGTIKLDGSTDIYVYISGEFSTSIKLNGEI